MSNASPFIFFPEASANNGILLRQMVALGGGSAMLSLEIHLIFYAK